MRGREALDFLDASEASLRLERNEKAYTRDGIFSTYSPLHKGYTAIYLKVGFCLKRHLPPMQ